VLSVALPLWFGLENDRPYFARSVAGVIGMPQIEISNPMRTPIKTLRLFP
jgi:hypothetical protein